MTKKTKYSSLSEINKKLIDSAETAMNNAFDIVSDFYVGSAVLTEKDNIYIGCNLNFCAYVGLCAERNAISNAFVNGERKINKIAIICKGETFNVTKLLGPCGICRQVIYEISEYQKKDVEILLVDTKKENVIITSISEMFPLGFGFKSCYIT